MKSQLTVFAAAILALGQQGAHAQLKVADNVTLSGFGTIGAVRSGNTSSDFIGTPFQTNGAGRTSEISFGPDSKAGLQLNAQLSDKFSAVVQVITQHQYDNSWNPQLEWANVKYQVTPELSIRAGRIALPSFLGSESRYVGYANPMVRQPIEVYTTNPITSNDGIDGSWRTRFGAANNTLQAYIGKSSANLPAGNKVKGSNAWGVNNTVEVGSLTLRAGYTHTLIDLEFASLNPLLGGVGRFAAAPAPIGPQAVALLEKYKMTGMKISTFALSFLYDPGDWFVSGEAVDFKASGFISDATSWYLSGGYRLGSFTPYAAVAGMKPKIEAEAGLSAPAAAPLNAGINGAIRALNADQNTATVGVRWDFMKNMAMKAQYDRIDLNNGSAGRQRVTPGVTPSDRINIVSVALDFVF